MAKTQESYLNERRPPLLDALKLEHETSLDDALESLKRKGYFTPLPRPWQHGTCDMGMGRAKHAVLDKFGDLVAEVSDSVTAEFIIAAVNAHE